MQASAVLTLEELPARELPAPQFDLPGGLVVIVLNPARVLVLYPLTPPQYPAIVPPRFRPELRRAFQPGLFIPPTPCVFGPLPHQVDPCDSLNMDYSDDCL